jgi:hypothetical protein
MWPDAAVVDICHIQTRCCAWPTGRAPCTGRSTTHTPAGAHEADMGRGPQQQVGADWLELLHSRWSSCTSRSRCCVRLNPQFSTNPSVEEVMQACADVLESRWGPNWSTAQSGRTQGSAAPSVGRQLQAHAACCHTGSGTSTGQAARSPGPSLCACWRSVPQSPARRNWSA